MNTDDLAWGTVTPRKCRRHIWTMRPAGTGIETVCGNCGKPKDPAASRRAVNNRKRGNAFERTVAKGYGATAKRAGQFGGLDDVRVGQVFAVQTKKLQAQPSLNYIRRILRAMDGIAERTPIFVAAEPGKDREALVIWWLRDHQAMHGDDGLDGGEEEVA